ncbi:hypothetical protein EVAR_85372_1 [Eumeta japonica]|uniref:Uncharacterized protein n=1 Tax=Eumeta variegata TaxID=151549 RepID=A0A4C1WV11_EUMVA|nr:hypothetical protein EVAR_85372_1 [Eumeta japonica]
MHSNAHPCNLVNGADLNVRHEASLWAVESPTSAFAGPSPTRRLNSSLPKATPGTEGHRLIGNGNVLRSRPADVRQAAVTSQPRYHPDSTHA